SATCTPLLSASLFPYTTLFRSESVRKGVCSSDRLSVSGQESMTAENDTSFTESTPPSPAPDHATAIEAGSQPTVKDSIPLAPIPDRKSTRLNSSHGSISYAVFC